MPSLFPLSRLVLIEISQLLPPFAPVCAIACEWKNGSCAIATLVLICALASLLREHAWRLRLPALLSYVRLVRAFACQSTVAALRTHLRPRLRVENMVVA